jgi:hypothetical protein
MVDNNENILVEFDYQNISVIDPNKVIDEDGNAKERVINQENLVFYANLECNVLPRTKLALGVPLTDTIRTISVGKINFLNPGGKTFIEETYVDEITGKDSLIGKGVNQPKLTEVRVDGKTEDYFLRQSTLSNGQVGATDNGLLGITQINISYGLDFLPVINITLEDVKGRALFESGNDSPYAAFFQLPYPLFYLTLKGYLGKATRLPLMLQTFNASFDPSTANFRINLTMYTYKYTIMSQVNWNAMMATPLMYQSSITTTNQTTTNGGSNESEVTKSWSSKGYSKIKELYAEYKSKGLIDDNFPELTIQELDVNLNKFLTSIVDKYSKTNLDVLNDLKNYAETLLSYQQNVFYFAGTDGGWARKYLDFDNPFVMKLKSGQDETVRVYQFKKEYESAQSQQTALTELSGLVKKYNKALLDNKTLGDGKPNSIPVDIKLDLTKIQQSTFYYSGTISDVDLQKTYSLRNNNKELPAEGSVEFNTFITNQFNSGTKFYFEGTYSFINLTNKISENYQTKKQKVEEELTKELTDQIKKSTDDGGLGFAPTIRNVLAVFFAQGEAFLRLLDEVHTKAWDLRDDETRKLAVFSTSSTVDSVDIKEKGVLDTPIYPWPQVILENNLKEDGEKYELVYPGNSTIAEKINAFSPEIWPEVQFVEEFLKASIERENPPQFPKSLGNFVTKPNRLSFNAIEFPINNEVYQNTEEVKFFYEIYERLLINAFYSKLGRDSNSLFNMTEYYSESEVLNMITALGTDNPFLTKKLKEYGFNSGNYVPFLQHISNQGSGDSWQNYIRGIFNTPYIKNDVNVPFSLFNQDIFDNDKSKPLLSINDTQYAEKYFGESDIVENYDFTDTYPITNLNWVRNNMADAKELQKVEQVFKTNQVLEYNTTNKIITNFADGGKDKQPVTSFNYKSTSNTYTQTPNLLSLKTFYNTREIKDQYVTEGNISYFDYTNKLVENQTTSMLNTPYFINAIQKGVYNFRYNLNELYPYKSAAFLFLNSLPLGTLREKYKEYNEDGSSNDLNYIISTIKKFGAVHKLPYAWVLKYGSIWHRYKTWVDNGVDFLDEVWTDFNYVDNFDPLTSAVTKNYELTLNSVPYNMILQDDIANGPLSLTYINVGFYPKLIDDFNVFYQGVRAFDSVAEITGTFTISGNTMEVLSVSSNDLFVGQTLSGSGVSFGTTILNQINGTLGGVGTYTINYPQNITTPTNFIVTNYTVAGFTSSSIQTAINNGLYIKKSTTSTITKTTGFDNNNIDRSLQITPWSCFIEDSTKGNIFPLPSFGSQVNQTADECFKANGTLFTEVSDNPAMYNGSVRLFWKAPNYGYFDNNRITKPSPEKYLKQILNEESQQQSFSFNKSNQDYSSISEMFTTFDKEILDILENEFLNFSKSVYDFSTSVPETNTTDPNSFKVELNFQALMRQIMKIPKPTGDITNGDLIIQQIQEAQITNFSQYISNFMEYKVGVKHGNPTFFDTKLFYTFSNQFIIDPYTFQGYYVASPNSLPTNGGTITLAQSKTQNPETWKALETYVGFSEVPGLAYSDNGSYITDFFIDNNVEFTETTIKNFAPIIKIYATQKLAEPNLTSSQFYTLMDGYIQKNITYLDTVLDIEFTNLRKKLAKIDIKPIDSSVKATQVQGEQTRYETWELFKTLNDSWISGTDFKTKTLFEDVLIVDRASRDVGQQVYVDVFKLKNMIKSANYQNSLFTTVRTILTENNFVDFVLPAYANFYNVKDVSKSPSPKPEGTLEFANSLFGTFLNVDYRETGPKFLCIYAWKPSQHLDLNENVDYRYRDDAFDMRRASDNPLLENIDGKTNWDKSNKVVGFNVDIGPQNQQIFKQLDISQDPGEPTAESLEILNQMANLERNRGGYSQSVSLYNLYKNRSYKCSIDMMGNALMQPTMYFNLRNVPLFSGPYMITKVSHRISEDGFDTTIEGQRQPFYSIPKIETYIQSLTTNILKDIQEKIKADEQAAQQAAVTSINLASDKVKTADNTNNATLTANQNCSTSLAADYTNYTVQDGVQSTTINKKDATNTIRTLVTNAGYTGDDAKLIGGFIYSLMTLILSPDEVFKTYGNNYSLIPLTKSFGGDVSSLFTNKYFCETSKNLPIAIFDSFESYVSFMIAKYGTQKDIFRTYANIGGSGLYDTTYYSKMYTGFYMNNYPTQIDDQLYDKLTPQSKTKIEKIMSAGYTEYMDLSGLSTSSNKINPLQQEIIKDPNTQAITYVQLFFPTTVGSWRIETPLLTKGKGPDPCVKVTNLLLTSFLTPSGSQLILSLSDIQAILNCTGLGIYTLSISVQSVPILADGTVDPDRKSEPQTFDISFTV